MSRRNYVVAIAFAALVCALRVEAAISPKFDDFVRGPAQWLMTGDEARAIRSAPTDEEAQKAVDLFWVRRDPTPGTPRNEFREEFESRVLYADQEFGFPGKRGSLTDQGKVFILLGPSQHFEKYAGMNAIEQSGDIAVHHGVGGRLEWSYPPGIGLTGPVVFIEKLGTGEYKYDLQHGNIGGALGMARQRAIVSAGLTEVPSWAAAKADAIVIPSLAPAAAAPVPRVATPTPALPAPPAGAVLPAGVHTLLLTKDVMAINPRSAGDPLAQTTATRSFTTQDDLGYAFHYCGGPGAVATPPALGLSLAISGESEGKKVHFSAADDDLVPDGIPALPGCYLVRGSLPLTDVGKGTYELALVLTDKASHQTYDLKNSFKVE